MTVARSGLDSKLRINIISVKKVAKIVAKEIKDGGGATIPWG